MRRVVTVVQDGALVRRRVDVQRYPLDVEALFSNSSTDYQARPARPAALPPCQAAARQGALTRVL